VWVLTGDKTDTAKSIAFSCRLITHEFVLFEFPEKCSTNLIRDKLHQFLNQILTDAEMEKKHALIVSLDEITKIMAKEDLKKSFYEVAIRCNAVLCCRVTPKQKAMMVNLVKERQPNITTLAIGDGANDVNMITAAHIGIGILGVEGRQAARASDYAIGQFQFLKRLLFVHGRESYRKNSYVVCYNFYKNCLFVMPQFWFGFVSYFSGQTLYDPWIYQLFNIVFACLPIIWFGIYDKEVSYDLLMKDTRYYVQGIIGKLFHSARFWKWIAYGIIQGVLVYLFSFYANDSITNRNGFTQDLWSNGSIAYSGIVLIVNIKILTSTYTHSYVSFVLFFGSTFIYYLTLLVLANFKTTEVFNHSQMIFTSWNFYLSTILLSLMCVLLDIGLNRILLTFGIIIDPLNIKIEEYEPKLTELKRYESENPTEINNNCIINFFNI
jgi:phospholipid-transporting ATPase